MKKRILNCKNRIFAFIMVVVTLLTSLPFSAFPVFSEEEDRVVITLDGQEIENLELSEHDKITLHAETDDVIGNTYAWQILDPAEDDRWINIYGQNQSDIAVTYAMIASMTTESGVAKIRCKLKKGENEYFSKPVTVTVSFSVPDASEQAPVGNLIGMQNVNLMKDSADNLGICTIVINYLFDNGSMAFEPYGATVAKGSDFNAVVTSPSVIGYVPYQRTGDDYVTAETVTLNYTNIQSNITINIIYEPALVNFSVHHHLQNLYDDSYSIEPSFVTNSQALTETIVPDGLAMEMPGFKALAYEKLTVAADGSTVVEIRYDRNYYLVDFEMSGGYGVEPVYTRYGTELGANQPVRHGYVFGGWELVSYGGETPTNEQKSVYDINGAGRTIEVPAANLRYRARWTAQQTTYTMVFWKENAEDNGYSYWGYLDNIPALSGSYVSGADRIAEVGGINDDQYFTFNSERTDKDVLVEGDGSTVVNVYYTRNYYKITFKASGNSCTIPTGHTHGDDCYDIICGKGHVHDESCTPKIICSIPEHSVHTDDCLICGLPEHTAHSKACCGKDEHTHTISCWRYVGNSATLKDAPANPVDGQIYRSGRYYIYIKGTWYRYNGYGASSGDIVDSSCNYDEEHKHGSSDCDCTLAIHVHSSACYKDVIHTHIKSCYLYSCGEVAHEHNDKCYRLKCGIPERHSHSTSCNNTIKVVYRKYDQSIADLWPVVDDNGKKYDSGQRWSPSSSSYYSQVLVYISNMPADDFTLTLSTASYESYIMNYYLEVLPEDQSQQGVVEYDGKFYKLDFTILANYNYVTKAEDFFNIKGFQQYRANHNFDSSGRIDLSRPSSNPINFYYDRLDDLVLEFNSNGITLDENKVTNVLYGASLKNYNFTPDYPTNLEPNAYEFAGWYTSPLCFDGTEVNWDTITMPDGNLLLYAKWAPIKHTVKIYKDSSLLEQIGSEQTVDHNAFATAPESIPQNGNYVFQGWFYKDVENGVAVEKAFVFTGIPVVKDINVYAKWSSHVSVKYTIRYVLKDTGVEIAEPTVGSTIAGNNKTFDAKSGTDLKTEYQVGYYPVVNSHTMTMSVNGNHEFTFEYVYVESMPYLVRYVDMNGNNVLPAKKVMDNNLSVVTETFVRVDKMMPDAYQKRLVLSASGDDKDKDGIYDQNVITFYYNSDEEHAYYRVVHYIQNIATNSYREYRSVETVGLIGQSYSVEALTLTGFAFVPGSTKVNGVTTSASGMQVTAKLGADGMLIELYYDRVTVDYTVKYIEYDTNKELVASKPGSGLYGAQIVEYAHDLTSMGYKLHSESIKTITLSANKDHNVIVFVYDQANASVKYQIVGPDGCGTLSQSSENTLAIEGILNGSVPSAANGYRFVGWYTDAQCSVEVNSDWVERTTNKLVPQKSSGEIWVDGTTFYAKFEADNSELTIVKAGIGAKDELQASIFRVQGVQGTRTEGIDLTVTVIGNNSVTVVELPLGNYTVTELTEWSWRYQTDEAVKEVIVSADKSVNTVTYHNHRVIANWLDGNAVSNNIFMKP